MLFDLIYQSFIKKNKESFIFYLEKLQNDTQLNPILIFLSSTKQIDGYEFQLLFNKFFTDHQMCRESSILLLLLLPIKLSGIYYLKYLHEDIKKYHLIDINKYFGGRCRYIYDGYFDLICINSNARYAYNRIYMQLENNFDMKLYNNIVPDINILFIELESDDRL